MTLLKLYRSAPRAFFLILVLFATSATMVSVSQGQYVADANRRWAEDTPPPGSDEVFRVFLVGDVGAVPVDRPAPILSALDAHFSETAGRSAVIFLGDNLYCCGLPDSASSEREQAEARLRAILETARKSSGRVIVIPGNHDWNSSRRGGLEAIKRQEKFVESFLNAGDTFLPSDGFPGPAKVDLTDEITLIVVDTEWYLTDHSRSLGDDGENEINENADLLVALQEEILKEHDKKLVVVGHHPLLSNGVHAGQARAREHLFPLTAIWENAYLPLPILGTLSVLYRRYLGVSAQDLSHPRNRSLREAFMRIFRGHENLVYASGHEHSLQYFSTGNAQHPNHYIISGAGSKTSFVAGGGDAIFAAGGLGYATLHYYKDGSSWVAFWRAEEVGSQPVLLFRARMVAGSAVSTESREVDLDDDPRVWPDYSDSVAVVAADPDLGAGRVRSLFMGSHNRGIWLEPVRAPYLDMGRDGGGLIPLKRGGGMQTTSLRLQGGDGKQYVLRSLDKDASRSLPEALRTTVAADILRDQIASINPYGAYAVPGLADAVGVYHTSPELVYVPADPRLGPYLGTFANRLMMFEERPDDDMSDVARYGFSRDVESARKMFSEINGDNDNQVDQRAFLRARLLDMLISDWDRHRDQWRWASFDRKDAKGRIFRPIPRDRDWAFNRLNGLLPPLVKFFDPKFQDFRETYGSLKGLNSSGLEQDRRFTSELMLEDWLEEARHMREALTDSVIEGAVGDMPESVVRIKGAEIARKLKIRRDDLPDVAERYYRILARVVDVVGTDKHELFVVRRAGDAVTEVVVYKTKKNGDKREEIYRRSFLAQDTDEIRLYGLDGHDMFDIKGTGGGLRVRCIGGPGPDVFASDDSVHHVVMHDSPTGSSFRAGAGTTVHKTDDPWVNTYDPRDYRHNVVLPQLFFGANEDDGVFLGGGARLVKHGFKKEPYARTHRIVANFAARTAAFNAVYGGHFVEVIRGYDLHLSAEVRSPNSIRNFYGLGNETENVVDDREYYQARLTQVNLSGLIGMTTPAGLSFLLGPTLRVTDVRSEENRRVVVPQPGLSNTTFEDQWFAGLHTNVSLQNLDRAVNPRRGFRWSNDANLNVGVRNSSSTYAKIASDLVVFTSPSLSPQLTIAARAGVQHTVGSFPFYDASTLGGGENLRGYRSTRFAGRTAFYQNIELRARLFRFSTYLAVGEAGLLAFADNGRVWTDGESSSAWHQGYGGGAWATLFRSVSLATWIGTSSDETTFTLKLGFQY